MSMQDREFVLGWHRRLLDQRDRLTRESGDQRPVVLSVTATSSRFHVEVEPTGQIEREIAALEALMDSLGWSKTEAVAEENKPGREGESR